MRGPESSQGQKNQLEGYQDHRTLYRQVGHKQSVCSWKVLWGSVGSSTPTEEKTQAGTPKELTGMELVPVLVDHAEVSATVRRNA